MGTQEQEIKILDFSQEKATDFLLPQPAILKSSGWDSIYFELHQQPKFDTPEHQGTWHVIAYCPPFSTSGDRTGERWLDGKRKIEVRNQGDIAIIPAGISQRCNWQILSQFAIVALNPLLLKQVGQDWVDELIPLTLKTRCKMWQEEGKRRNTLLGVPIEQRVFYTCAETRKKSAPVDSEVQSP